MSSVMVVVSSGVEVEVESVVEVRNTSKCRAIARPIACESLIYGNKKERSQDMTDMHKICTGPLIGHSQSMVSIENVRPTIQASYIQKWPVGTDSSVP